MAGPDRRGWGATTIAFAGVGAAVVIAVLTGCSAGTGAEVIAASASPANISDEVPAGSDPSPGPTHTMPPEWCEPSDFPRASLLEATPPAPGEHLILELDPCLTVKSLLGSYAWLEDQGIDADMIQGFQSVAGIEPWTAPLADGDGDCILIRAADHNGWGEIACDSLGVTRATVERTVDGSTLRFMIEDGAITVSGIAR